MEYVAFYKKSRSPSRARQERLMDEYDFWHVVDGQVDDAIKMMRAGRALVVAQLGLLGRVGPELQEIAERVHDAGGCIIEAATGRDSRNPADAIAMGMDALKRKKITNKQARENALIFDDQMFVDAMPRWKAGEPKASIAADLGVSISTLTRRMHELGAKHRSGGRPKIVECEGE